MERYLCIHGHFYQPPRESAWFEAIEVQDSAFPYHDWNERIAAECYAPNATARILDGDQNIRTIVNNYASISFNFGPTLLAWMEDQAPDLLASIVEADKESVQRFSGHGSAVAQAYNHMILPLANKRDKKTQIEWGIRDFEHRFGRKPEGMWLPECAVDSESLDLMADAGLKFTVLSPFQASKTRKIGATEWQDVNGARIDPSRPYRVTLPSGRSIAVFFYDAPLSKAVAFERMLNDGGVFARRLMDGFDASRQGDQLMHIATDGESYGHHHRHGEMALAYAIHDIQANKLATLTNYAEFLEKHPPENEAQIHENSAWSCSHGVGRWHADCGCNSGGHGDWNQKWRQPLREALDWLRDQLAPAYEAKAKEFLKDPWAARDDYINVILDRSDANITAFFQRNAARELSAEDQIECLRLLEMQRHALLMFTSCGWFFDELSGIETVQVIQYAGRVLQIAKSAVDKDLEPEFLERLSKAKSNLPEHGDGKQIYERFVKPSIVDREHLAAHFAVSSLFRSHPDKGKIYKFSFDQEKRRVFKNGSAKLLLGQTKVTYDTTRASDTFTWAVSHRGDYDIDCRIRYAQKGEAFPELEEEFGRAFEREDWEEIGELMDRHFGKNKYTFKSLFRDEQRKILEELLVATRKDLEYKYRQIAEQSAPVMKFLKEVDAPLPSALQATRTFIVNAGLVREFRSNEPDPAKLRALWQEACDDKVEIYRAELIYTIKAHMDRHLDHIATMPEDVPYLARTADVAEVVHWMNLDANLWKTQNSFFKLLNNVAPAWRDKAAKGDAAAAEWFKQFERLGVALGFKIDSVPK
jgi:alpha-amylase/alpha-mannosidase (GH57 family)